MEHRSSRAGRPDACAVEPLSAELVRCWTDAEAMVIRQLLMSYGIEARSCSTVSMALFPLSCGLGEIRVLVRPSRLAEARRLLAEQRRSGLRSIRGGLHFDPSGDDPE